MAKQHEESKMPRQPTSPRATNVNVLKKVDYASSSFDSSSDSDSFDLGTNKNNDSMPPLNTSLFPSN